MTIGAQNITNMVARLTPEQRQDLEIAIANINSLRGKKDSAAWRREWNGAHRAAASVMGLQMRNGSSEDWNQLIDTLDVYRKDWRGYVVTAKYLEVAA